MKTIVEIIILLTVVYLVNGILLELKAFNVEKQRHNTEVEMVEKFNLAISLCPDDFQIYPYISLAGTFYKCK